MKQLSQKAASAFTMLRGNPDFVVVMEWITENRDAATEECCKQLDDVKLRQSQGKQMALQHILESSQQAPLILEKFNHK